MLRDQEMGWESMWGFFFLLSFSCVLFTFIMPRSFLLHCLLSSFPCCSLTLVDSDSLDMSNVFLSIACLFLLVSCSSDVIVFFIIISVSRFQNTSFQLFFDVASTELGYKFGFLRGQPPTPHVRKPLRSHR